MGAHWAEDVAAVERGGRGRRQPEVAVLEDACLDDAAERLRNGPDEAVVRPDEEVAPPRANRDREPVRADTGVDDADRDADPEVRQRAGEQDRPVADRELP